ncbi:hypothetical protein YC2023_087655 [Brassica napus]
MAESLLIGLIKQTSPSSRNINSNSSREKNLSLCSSCFRSRDLGNIITQDNRKYYYKSRISDVSYEERDDPDGGLKHKGLSVSHNRRKWQVLERKRKAMKPQNTTSSGISPLEMPNSDSYVDSQTHHIHQHTN